MTEEVRDAVVEWLVLHGYRETVALGLSRTFESPDGSVRVKLVENGGVVVVEIWTPAALRVGVPAREAEDPSREWLAVNLP